MSPPSWKALLQQWVTASKRLAIVGVGHELRGDDAAGLLVVRSVQSTAGTLVVEAGPAPENVSSQLRSFAPDAILLIDAAQLGLSPGSIRWVEADNVSGLSASSHTLPLNLVMAFWQQTLGCQVALLGIQPTTTEFGAAPTPEVTAACHAMAVMLADTAGLPYNTTVGV